MLVKGFIPPKKEKSYFLGIKPVFCGILQQMVTFFAFIQFLEQKLLKMTISTSIWCAPNRCRNIQQAQESKNLRYASLNPIVPRSKAILLESEAHIQMLCVSNSQSLSSPGCQGWPPDPKVQLSKKSFESCLEEAEPVWAALSRFILVHAADHGLAHLVLVRHAEKEQTRFMYRRFMYRRFSRHLLCKP